MTTKKRFDKVLSWFRANVPVAETELHYETPYQLMVAVILSAQCTDKRVNIVTPAFFERFPDAESLSEAEETEIFELIKSISYPNNKTRHLWGMAKMLTEDFGGKVPDNTDDLQKLPGVGRKTANVIASVVYKQPVMAVDTHVFRVSERIGLTTEAKTPLDAEKQLMKYIPIQDVAIAHHWLILHGRYVCLARKPKCEECGINKYCKYYDSYTIVIQ
ncbi:MAG: endonuclease III [Prevotellaceae bacterium]|nr:endonuclease III [Prevotellaceae bacterium]